MLSFIREPRRVSAAGRIFIIVAALLWNTFAVLRALPVNSSLPENREPNRGVYSRNVYRVFKLANRQASRPFFAVKNHAIFFDRNPGLFMFAAELCVRAGATTPLPNQLFAIVLWDAGLLLLYLWLLRLFDHELPAAVGTAFTMWTPFLLFYSSSIHHEPWCFVFFNLTLYCYVRYLQEDRPRRWLVGTCIGYFLVCQSYWFYYMSMGIMLLALQVRERKVSLRDTLILGAVPVVATLTTFLQVVYALGGFEQALFRMKDIAAARTLDMRIENSQWFPDKKFVRPEDFDHYPRTVKYRIEMLSGYHLGTFAAMLFAAVCCAGRAAWSRLSWLLLVLFAGISWHLVMIQHTVIHRFAGMYGWFMWTLIAAVFVHELWQVLRPERARWVMAGLLLPAAVYILQVDYLPYLDIYIDNARAGSVQASEPGKKVKTKPKPGPRSDKLSDDDMKE